MGNNAPSDDESLGSFFRELMGMLGGISSASPNAMGDLAKTIATSGEAEPNVDPSERKQIDQLVRLAEMQVEAVTPLRVPEGMTSRIEVVNRTQWVEMTIDHYKPLIGDIADSLSTKDPAKMQKFVEDLGFSDPDDSDISSPINQLFVGLSQVLESMIFGITCGTMFGEAAAVAFGGYHYPIPRAEGAPMMILLPNVDEFGAQWSLDADDLRLWVCLRETALCAVLDVEQVQDRLNDLLKRHASAFELDLDAFHQSADRFDIGSFGTESGLAEAIDSLGTEGVSIGTKATEEQLRIRVRLAALVSVICGYVDYVMGLVGDNLIGSYGMISEAMRRRRAESDGSAAGAESVFGVVLSQETYERGVAFIRGVEERAGRDGIDRLFERPENLPTPAEVDAPGLWLARIDLPED